jgi:hypothetical protein
VAGNSIYWVYNCRLVDRKEGNYFLEKTLNFLYKLIMGFLIFVIIGIYALSLFGLEFYPFSVIFGLWILISVIFNIVVWVFKLVVKPKDKLRRNDGPLI